MITVFNFIILKLKKRSWRWVHPYSVSQSGCRDVPFKRILTGTNHLPCYASLQAGMGSIPVGRDPFNSDQAGMPLSLQVILCCKFSLCNNVAIVFNYLLCYQVYSEGKCITLSVIKFNNSDLLIRFSFFWCSFSISHTHCSMPMLVMHRLCCPALNNCLSDFFMIKIVK